MLELGKLLEQLALRPTMFWIGSSILAAGASCLAAALVLALRRRRALARSAACTGDRGPAAGDSRDSRPSAAHASALPEFSAGLTASRLMPDSHDESSSALLLRRLRIAGDRLEDVAADLGVFSLAKEAEDESALKARGTGVEYVFKAKSG